MKHLFIPYELAVIAKEKGFNEPCLMIYYDNTDELRGQSHFLYSRDIKAPLYQQIVDWFRHEHDIHIHAESFRNGSYDYVIVYDSFSENELTKPKPLFDSYYQAINAAITEAFKLIP